MLSGHPHASHAQARLCRVQPGNKLGRVASVAPHYGSVVAHIRRGQGEERLAGLIGGDGGNVSRAEAGLGGLCFTSVVVGAAV